MTVSSRQLSPISASPSAPLPAQDDDLSCHSNESVGHGHLGTHGTRDFDDSTPMNVPRVDVT